MENLESNNISLAFLPGVHSLSSDLSINAVSKLSMYSNSILSPSATVSCQEQANFTLSYIDNVYIGHLNFIGCQGHQVTSIKAFLLEDVTFINHTGLGLKIVSSYASIVRCSFISNSGGSYQQQFRKAAENVHNNVTYANAGAVRLTNCSANISDCIFEGNHAKKGGAIFSELHSSVTLVNTVFEKNYAMCSFDGGGGTKCTASGGALYSEYGTVLAYNCTFVGNKLS